MIRKTAKGYQVVSEEGKPLSSDDLTEEQAHARLAEVESFKATKGDSIAPSFTRETRYDVTGKFDSSRRTPQGGLRLPAYVTRVGVLTYRRNDGSTVRELRHPDEVFKADSMASLAGASITVGHPGKVQPENWKNHTVGTVGDTVEPKNDRFVSATLRVQDAKAVAAVEKGELLELSCGYDCDVEPSSGEWQGEKYDAIQRNISYNHVALLPKNGGRAGNDVRIRFDGWEDGPVVEKVDEAPKETPALNSVGTMTPEEIKKLQEDAAKARQDAADAKAALDRANGERDALKAQVAELSDPKRMDAAVEKTVQLREDARTILGADADLAGKDYRGLMVEALTKADSTFKADGYSDEYLRGRFDIEVAKTRVASGSLAKARQDAAAGTTDENPVEAAQRRNRERSQSAWKGDKK